MEQTRLHAHLHLGHTLRERERERPNEEVTARFHGSKGGQGSEFTGLVGQGRVLLPGETEGGR